MHHKSGFRGKDELLLLHHRIPSEDVFRNPEVMYKAGKEDWKIKDIRNDYKEQLNEM